MPKKFLLALFLLFFCSGVAASSTFLNDLNFFPNPAYPNQTVHVWGYFDVNATLDINATQNGNQSLNVRGWQYCQDFNVNHIIDVESFEYMTTKSALPSFSDCNSWSLGLYWWEDTNIGGNVRQFIARRNPDINNSLKGTYGHQDLGNFSAVCDWNYSNFYNRNLTELVSVQLTSGVNYSLCLHRDSNYHVNQVQSQAKSVHGLNYRVQVAGADFGADFYSDLNIPEIIKGTPSITYDDLFFKIYSFSDLTHKLQCGDSNAVFNLCDGEFGVSSPAFCPFENPFDGNINQAYSDNNVFCRVQDSNGQYSNVKNKVLSTYAPLQDAFECEGIENATCSIDENKILISVIDGTAAFKFSLRHLSSLVPHNVKLLVQTELSKAKSYYVYTALNDLNDLSFDNTFTHGVDAYTSLQRHYNFSTGLWEYSQSDYFAGVVTKYYDFKINNPLFYWESVENSTDWTKSINPEWNEALRKDVYMVSASANLRNTGEFELPDVNSSDANYDLFYLTLSGYADYAYGNQKLWVGYLDSFKTKYETEYDLYQAGAYPYNYYDYNDSTYSFLTSAVNPYLETLNNYPGMVYLGDYMLSSSSYFLSPLRVLDLSGNNLPVGFNDSNAVFKYLDEGQAFRVKASIKGSEEIDYIAVSVYLNQVDDFNKIVYRVYDYNAGNVLYDFDVFMPPVFDLTNNAPDEDIKVVVKIVFNDGYSEVASDWIKFYQFPKGAGDLSFQFNQVNRIIGSSPKGEVQIKTAYPDLIKGVYFVLKAVGDSDSNDFEVHLIKDKDFFCNGFSCDFSYKITDYVFPAAGLYSLTVLVDTYAEYKNYSNANFFKTLSFVVNWKNFDTARIFEVLERADATYRNTEAIPFVLQMRDSPDERGGYPNLKDDVDVVMRIALCNGSLYGNTEGSCPWGSLDAPAGIDINYHWTSFVYDAETGYNYWFFRNIFVDESDNLISGDPQEYGQMHLRVFAEVRDKKNTHNQSVIYPMLTKKCHFYPYLEIGNPGSGNTDLNLSVAYAIDFFGHLLNMNQYLFGCQEYQSPIVKWGDQVWDEYPYTSQESRITLNNSRELLDPSQEAVICLKPDNTGKFKNGLDQGLYCAVIYKLSENIPDRLQFIIKNENSDLSEGDPEYQQYISLSVPYEYLLFNDPNIMKQALQVNQDTSINTIGDVVYYGFNKVFVGIANPLADIALPMFYNQDYNSKLNGAFVNIGADINFQNTFDPRFVSGILFYRVNGIKVINAYDYRYESKMDGVKLDEFVKWAKQNSVRLNEKTTKIQVYASDMSNVYTQDVASRLVIYEEPETNNIDQSKLPDDANFTEPPKELRFDIISDLIWGNEQQAQRAYIPFAIVTNIKWTTNLSNIFNGVIQGFQDVLNGDADPFDIGITWVFQNILIIIILVMVLIIVSYVRRAWNQ